MKQTTRKLICMREDIDFPVPSDNKIIQEIEAELFLKQI